MVLLAAIMIAACTKKNEYTDKNYYAKVIVDVAELPGTPPLEVRYQGQTLGDVPLRLPGAQVQADKNAKLSVYIKGTDQLVADTTFNLKRGTTGAYRVAYSKDFGLSGWLNSKPVSPDSLSVQLLNNLGDFFKAYEAYDLKIFQYSYDVGDFVDYKTGIQNFQNYKLAPNVLTYPFDFDKVNGLPGFYIGRLIDRATGQYIIMPSGQDYFNLPQEFGGANYIFNIHDNTGEITVDSIYL